MPKIPLPDQLATHEVLNQPPPLVDFNAFELDVPLQSALERSGASAHCEQLSLFGKRIGSFEAIEWGVLPTKIRQS
ncbi:hypothetical protein FHS61_000742 [Altererythrobacter atlanticus]|nr:hypothetical protein [Croceibacterium atlanticum]MBB5731738.1 hypothetical protein [Croceibacterium atlanticum]